MKIGDKLLINRFSGQTNQKRSARDARQSMKETMATLCAITAYYILIIGNKI